MDEAFRPGGILEKGPVKPVKDSSVTAIKKDDIDIIVRRRILQIALFNALTWRL